MKYIHFFCGADFLRHALAIPTPERPFWLRSFEDAVVYLTRRFRGYPLEFNTLPGAVEIPVVFWSSTGNAGFDLSFSEFDNCGGHLIPHLFRQVNDVVFAGLRMRVFASSVAVSRPASGLVWRIRCRVTWSIWSASTWDVNAVMPLVAAAQVTRLTWDTS